MKISKWILLNDIPYNMRLIIRKKVSSDVYELVIDGRQETWGTLYLVTSKICNGLINETTTL